MPPEGEAVETGGTAAPATGETGPEPPSGEVVPPQPGAEGAEEAPAPEGGAEDGEQAEAPEPGARKGWIPHSRAEEMARRRAEKAVEQANARFRQFIQANLERFDPAKAEARTTQALADRLIASLRPDLVQKSPKYLTDDQIARLIEEKLQKVDERFTQEREEATKRQELAEASNHLDQLQAKYREVFEAFPDLPEVLTLRWGSKKAVEAGLSMLDVGEATIQGLLKSTDAYVKVGAARRAELEREGRVAPARGSAGPAKTGKPPPKAVTMEDAEAEVDRFFDAMKREA